MAVSYLPIFALLLLSCSIGSEAYSLKITNEGKHDLQPKANWPEVQIHLDEMDYFVLTTLLRIYNDAIAADSVIGKIIGEKVNHAGEDGMDLLNIVKKEVQDKTLTVEIAKRHLGNLFVLFTDLYADISPELEQLNEEYIELINAEFSQLFLVIPGMAEKIYDALEQPTPPSCGIRGFNANETVSPEEPVNPNTPPGVIFWSEVIFGVESTFVLTHPHNKYLDSEVAGSTQTLWIMGTLDFPNFMVETNMTSIHRVFMFQCHDGTSVMYECEFPLDDGPIVEPTLRPELN